MNRKRLRNAEDIRTPSHHSAAQQAMAPDGFGKIPEIAGVDWHANAKIVQRLIDTPKIRNTILSHITVNEMQDQADDGTNFLGYANDN